MPPKRRKRRRREDESVIKTEPDTRRADRENDDTFELTDEETEVKKTTSFTTVEYNRYLRSKARSKARKSSQEVQLDDPFPFLRLSPEIRNMIYRYLVVSKSPYPIRLDFSGCLSQGGIETAILVANRQVYNEASKILCHENVFQVPYLPWNCRYGGVPYRVDSPRDASATIRQLRNGRAVDMVKHDGLIYEHVFHRLRNVELMIEVYDKTLLQDYMNMVWVSECHRTFWPISKTITALASKEVDDLRGGACPLSLVIQSSGLVGHKTLRTILQPILKPEIFKAVRDGKLKVKVDGIFPQNWESIFSKMMGPGFSPHNLEVLEDPGNLDGKDLDVWFPPEENGEDEEDI